MAGFLSDHDAQRRHLPASARRLAKARAEGQVARSRDLSHFSAIAGCVALLTLFAPSLAQTLREVLRPGVPAELDPQRPEPA